MLDRLMTRLAYSGILEPSFQKLHLAINYAILGLTLVAYLVFSLPEYVITLGALPGALVFLVSLQAFSYRKSIEGETVMLNPGMFL